MISQGESINAIYNQYSLLQGFVIAAILISADAKIWK